MGKPRTRQPRELLAGIMHHTQKAWRMSDDEVLQERCKEAWHEAANLQITLPPDPPKRSWYGQKGGLRNPSHSKQ
jgi:hypothetical protein